MSNLQKEAEDRNALLVLRHGKIPSYGLWMESDIKKESLVKRISWWKDSPMPNHELTLFWLNKLNNHISSNTISNEFCAKRMGDELYCDI